MQAGNRLAGRSSQDLGLRKLPVTSEAGKVSIAQHRRGGHRPDALLQDVALPQQLGLALLLCLQLLLCSAVCKALSIR